MVGALIQATVAIIRAFPSVPGDDLCRDLSSSVDAVLQRRSSAASFRCGPVALAIRTYRALFDETSQSFRMSNLYESGYSPQAHVQTWESDWNV